MLHPNEFRLTREVGLSSPLLYAGEWVEGGIRFRCDEPNLGMTVVDHRWYGPHTPEEIAQMFDQTVEELPPPTPTRLVSPSA